MKRKSLRAHSQSNNPNLPYNERKIKPESMLNYVKYKYIS